MYYKVFLSSLILWGAIAASVQAADLTLSDEDFTSKKAAAIVQILENTSIDRKIKIMQGGVEYDYSLIAVEASEDSGDSLSLDRVISRILKGAKTDNAENLILLFFPNERPYLLTEYTSGNTTYTIDLYLKKNDKHPYYSPNKTGDTAAA